MCTQHKSQGAFLEIFSKLISTFSAFVHFDFESPKFPFFVGSLRVRCTIRAFWHDFPPSSVIGKIVIYRFRDTFASNFIVLFGSALARAFASGPKNRTVTARIFLQYKVMFRKPK